jgi:hypothetical protein
VVEGEIGSREEEAAVLSSWSGKWSYALPKPSWRNWKGKERRERERESEGDEERILTTIVRIQAPLP